MTDRDRLIELMLESEILCTTCGECSNTYCAEALADHLLANGVILPQQGKWIESRNFGYWHYECPFCYEGYAVKEKDDTPPNYCQDCGARLKECAGR